MEANSESRPNDAAKVRASLEARLAQVKAELQALADADRGALQSGAQMQYGKRIGDHTSDALEHTRKVGMAETLEALQRQIVAALEKLNRGTYGRCEGCRKPIPEARLQALPWASRCIPCQEQADRCPPSRRR